MIAVNSRMVKISIHALREEGDSTTPPSLRTEVNFYPRPPRGGRPNASLYWATTADISIHALREEGDSGARQKRVEGHQISIHALREEGDYSHRAERRVRGYFYPRPPRGGRPVDWYDKSYTLEEFLSTPSARRATNLRSHLDRIIYISIHALREEGDLHTGHHAGCAIDISIHALREEGDWDASWC